MPTLNKKEAETCLSNLVKFIDEIDGWDHESDRQVHVEMSQDLKPEHRSILIETRDDAIEIDCFLLAITLSHIISVMTEDAFWQGQDVALLMN